MINQKLTVISIDGNLDSLISMNLKGAREIFYKIMRIIGGIIASVYFGEKAFLSLFYLHVTFITAHRGQYGYIIFN